jgi:hypothetical protein
MENIPVTLVSWVSLAIAGSLLYRYCRLNRWGILLWCLGGGLICAISREWPFKTATSTEKVDSLVWMAVTTLIASGIVFLVAAVKDRSRRPGKYGGLALAAFTLFVWFAAVATVRQRLVEQERADETTHALIELHRLAAEIESLRLRIGRLPQDEEECVRLRGEPMPRFGRYGRISYAKHDADHYALTCCMNDFWGCGWDIFGYILVYRGPTSTQRLHVELF